MTLGAKPRFLERPSTVCQAYEELRRNSERPSLIEPGNPNSQEVFNGSPESVLCGEVTEKAFLFVKKISFVIGEPLSDPSCHCL